MKTHQQPLVSVITPVYNGEKYLAECIESVLSQTYANWEYLIINNRSTDGTLALAESYARRDARIRVETNEDFVGVIQNHNIAFRAIDPYSRYCKLVHADDWLYPDCLSAMVEVAESHPSVGIVGSYGLYGDQVRCDGLPYPSSIVSGREISRLNLLRDVYVFLSPSSVLFRSELLRQNDPFYNELYLYADVEASYEVLQQADFGFVHQVLTYIRRHDESLTASVTQQYNQLILSNFSLLIKFGPIYLSRNEYEARLEEQMDECYHFLAKGLLRTDAKRALWKYYRKELDVLGLPFHVSKFLRACLIECGIRVVRPEPTLASVSQAKPGFVPR